MSSERQIWNGIHLSEPSDWQCRIAGITYRPEKGKEPNWFWMWTQYLAFGAKWERAMK